MPMHRHMLIFGMGYTASRLADSLRESGWHVTGTRRMSGGDAIAFDDEAAVCAAIENATHILSSVPPNGEGGDPVLLKYGDRIARGDVAWLGYLSSTGVYGDTGGAWVDETRRVNPVTDRAQRRVDAEAWLHAWGRHAVPRVSVLRIPGIYALDREGGTPKERLQRATPVLQPLDDVYTNHIHADDLARATVLSLWRGRPLRVVNVSDDSDLMMGDYMDWAADLWQLPRPPRISRAQAQTELPAMSLSFMSESRRLHNQRLKQELRLKLGFPTVREGLQNPTVV
jgi:nucleoside-diphosphate-sugar epimerase